MDVVSHGCICETCTRSGSCATQEFVMYLQRLAANGVSQVGPMQVDYAKATVRINIEECEDYEHTGG